MGAELKNPCKHEEIVHIKVTLKETIKMVNVNFKLTLTMSERIKDEELKGLAEIYNSKGRNQFYGVLRDQYEIKNPYFVFQRMKRKPYLTYDDEKDLFLMEASLAEADEVFMSMEELCAPVVSHHELPGTDRTTAGTEQIRCD